MEQECRDELKLPDERPSFQRFSRSHAEFADRGASPIEGIARPEQRSARTPDAERGNG
jgi:hypothetical protein